MKKSINRSKLLTYISFNLSALFLLLLYSNIQVLAQPIDPPGLEIAKSVQKAHTPNLLNNPDVVGTAVGLDEKGKPLILVLTKSRQARGIPQSLNGFPVVQKFTGEIVALNPPPHDHSKGDNGKDSSPSASFTYSCSGLTCDFDGSDSSGKKLSYAWDFDDGNMGSGKRVSHTFPADGTYNVLLEVTDKDSNTAQTNNDVVVSDGGGGGGSELTTTDRWPRPVPIGISTGHPSITAGTIGCRVTDGTNVYALSNNHVYAVENFASIGDEVIQPGTFDGGSLVNDVIGTLYDFVEICFLFDWIFSDCIELYNTVDAAIALTTINDLDNVTPPDGYGVPKSTTLAPSVGLAVKKYGRTTEETMGMITGINVVVAVGYSTDTAYFSDQIMIEPGGFSAGGDSGSLIVVDGGPDDRKPVGLLFAGSPEVTIANPINLVLTSFGVTVDGE